MTYSHHRVALFGKKDSQERLASRISALLDITLNCDNGSANLMCAKSKQRVESLAICVLAKQILESTNTACIPCHLSTRTHFNL